MPVTNDLVIGVGWVCAMLFEIFECDGQVFGKYNVLPLSRGMGFCLGVDTEQAPHLWAHPFVVRRF